MLSFKKMTTVEKKYFIKHAIFIVLGSFALAFGTAIFLTPLNIVSGGLSGIGIILQHYIPNDFLGGQIVDVVTFVFTWILWVVGLFTLGKEFAFKTLASSIIYPLALALFLRAPIFMDLASAVSHYGLTADQISALTSGQGVEIPIANLLLNGIFGGVFVGTGVALCFRGGGSTGGFDVLIALANKYLGIKESVVSIILDGLVVVCGMFFIPKNVIPGLCGIISACVSAFAIEYFYNQRMTSLQADIISDKWEEISKFVQDVLGRGATVIDVKGGYKGDNRIILRVVFDKTQYKAMREFIGKIDPNAFMTFTQTFGVYGEGFNQNKSKKKAK